MNQEMLRTMALTVCKSELRQFSIDPARARRENETPQQWAARLLRMDLGMADPELARMALETSIACELADRLIFRSRIILAA